VEEGTKKRQQPGLTVPTENNNAVLGTAILATSNLVPGDPATFAKMLN
jgi:hypothetical protein